MYDGDRELACNHTDGLRDLAHSAAGVPLDDAARLLVLVLVIDELRGKVVLDNLCKGQEHHKSGALLSMLQSS